MAATPGKNASLTFAGITLLLKEWTVDENIDMMEITAFSDAGIEKMLGGVKRWTATANGSFDVGNTADIGDSQTLTLTPVGGTTWSGTAFLSGKSAASAVDAPNTMNYTFTGSGALTPPS